MIKITFKELWARKLRLFTTGLAVLLGVAFMSGTLVLGDTISKTFDELFATVNAGTDAFVRGEAAFEDDFGQEQRPRLDESVLAQVQSAAGVEVAEGGIEGYAQVIGKDGDAIGNPSSGPPTFGRNWTLDPELNPFDLVEGNAPEGEDEAVIDRFTAKEGDFVLGDTAKVLLEAGAVDVTVVGIAAFGDSDSAGGTTNVMFALPAAQQLIAEPGKLDAISVRAQEGVSQEEVRDAIAAGTPAGVEVLTGDEITKETQDAIGEFVSFFSTFLLVFAVIALIVGSFIIYNTFSIIVAQRTREMALFRAVGASRRQVLGSVLIESIIVGLVASVLRLLAGIGVASGLKSLLSGFGLDIPAGSLVVSGTTIVTALLAGTIVCVASAVFPARRASKVAPLAAIRDVSVDRSGRSRVRLAAGILITGLGVTALFYGLWGNSDSALVLVGLGALLVIVGVAVLGPVFSAPLSRLIGAPVVRLRGMSGRLARENATRNPTRTATTASALMIGVALVGFIAILASSIKASIATSVDRAFTGDFVVDSGTFGFGGLPPELTDQLNERPEVEVASGIRLVPMEIDGNGTFIIGVDPETVGELVDVGFVAGGYADLDEQSIAVFDETAEDEGLSVGDPVPVRFAETGAKELRVAAIYTEDDLAGPYLVSQALADANLASQFDFQVYVNGAPDAPVESARGAIQQVVDGYPTAELQDRTEFKDAQAAQIDPILGLIYVLLAFSVIIAMFGIANTLALSIFERTRELGLLRAVGMTRSQLRSTVRWESVIISLLGTVLGLVIGVFFGWSLVTALSDEGFNTLAVPWATLIVVTLLAAVFGVIAALRPASRAAKLDVLEAMATT